jgi:CubicO group peptidase (beta-lactamase class C family)
MSRLGEVESWLEERLPALMREHGVPAMSVAVLAGDERIELATGVLNKNTGVEATTDSVFQIGSITKPWTATLVMQLVDDGLLDLDVPVREYLPAFRLANVDASLTVTARHLLSHTSGVEGDVVADVGRGDDAIERIVTELLPDVPQLFPPGALYSYSNLGFVVLGRIVEFLRGKPYRDVLVERLADPLGLRTVSPLADDAIRHRAAIGHVPTSGGWQPAGVWARGYGGLPAGSMLAMSAGDLLAFAQPHLRDGDPLLSPESARAMRTPNVELPPLTDTETAYGLGWTLESWHGGQVVTHRGGTIGQAARLHLVPEHGVAAVAMANRGHPDEIVGAVLGHVINELTGIEPPADPRPPARPERVADPARYVGRYEDHATRIDIEADENGDLWRVFQAKSELDKLIGHTESERYRIVRLRDDTFIAVYDEEAATSETYAFLGSDELSRATFLHIGTACPRVS